MTETKAPVELTSILNQVQALQADREKLMAELESTKSQMGKLQVIHTLFCTIPCV